MVSMASQMTCSSRQANQAMAVRQEVPYLLVGQGAPVFMDIFRETFGQLRVSASTPHNRFDRLPERCSEYPILDGLITVRNRSGSESLPGADSGQSAAQRPQPRHHRASAPPLLRNLRIVEQALR